MTLRDNPSDGQKGEGPKRPIPLAEAFARTKSAVSNAFTALLTVDESRKRTVREDIAIGSTPRVSYYVLLSISILIAGFGLVTNSPAVVIGAMLVSPLMTPIFGISLGLIRGNMTLLRKAIVAEFGGVVIAIGVAVILGYLPFAYEVTTEMLVRTRPTLLDLLVAALAGLAGCLAMIDERISPVLPGIAMATALSPPLAVSGLCIAFGAFEGAWGAFLLFFANFLAILVVSAFLFVVAGFVSREEMGSKLNVLKRFSGPVVGLIFVTVLLTHALMGIVGGRRTTEAIKGVLEKELSAERGALVEKVVYKRKAKKINILASVTTPRVLSPKRIKEIQTSLDERLDSPTNLIVRCEITKDISSTGSTSAVVARNLDGVFISSQLHPRVKRAQIAEQVLREILEEYPGFYLVNLDQVELSNEAVLIASMQSSRTLIPDEVARFEKAIQERLGDKDVRLLVRSDSQIDISSKGRILYGRAHFGHLSSEAMAFQDSLEQRVKAEIMRMKDMFVPNVDAVKKKGGWYVRAEVVGPRILTPSEVNRLEKRVSKAIKEKVTIHAWCRVELMVTGSHFVSVEGFTKEQGVRRIKREPSGKTD